MALPFKIKKKKIHYHNDFYIYDFLNIKSKGKVPGLRFIFVLWILASGIIILISEGDTTSLLKLSYTFSLSSWGYI